MAIRAIQEAKLKTPFPHSPKFTVDWYVSKEQATKPFDDLK